MLVKKYARSSADTNVAGRDFLRPPFVLHKAVRYLLTEILPANWPTAERRLSLYCFLQDRLRAVRQDFTVAFSLSADFGALAETLESYELMVRFYLAALDPLRAFADFDEKLWGEGFVQSLETLCQGYLRSETRARETGDAARALFHASPATAAHLRYYVFVKSFEEPLVFFNAVSQFRRALPSAFESAALGAALRLAERLSAGDFAAYFRAIERAPPLFAALLSHKTFLARVRVDFHRSLRRALKPSAPHFEERAMLFNDRRDYANFLKWIAENKLESADVSPRQFIPKLCLLPLNALSTRVAAAPIEELVDRGDETRKAPIETLEKAPIEILSEAPIETLSEAPIETFGETLLKCRKRAILRIWRETAARESAEFRQKFSRFVRAQRTAARRRVFDAFCALLNERRKLQTIWAELPRALSPNTVSPRATQSELPFFRRIAAALSAERPLSTLYTPARPLRLFAYLDDAAPNSAVALRAAFGVDAAALPFAAEFEAAGARFAFAARRVGAAVPPFDVAWLLSTARNAHCVAAALLGALPRGRRGLKAWLRARAADAFLVALGAMHVSVLSLRDGAALNALNAQITAENVGLLLAEPFARRLRELAAPLRSLGARVGFYTRATFLAEMRAAARRVFALTPRAGDALRNALLVECVRERLRAFDAALRSAEPLWRESPARVAALGDSATRSLGDICETLSQSGERKAIREKLQKIIESFWNSLFPPNFPEFFVYFKPIEIVKKIDFCLLKNRIEKVENRIFEVKNRRNAKRKLQKTEKKSNEFAYFVEIL